MENYEPLAVFELPAIGLEPQKITITHEKPIIWICGGMGRGKTCLCVELAAQHIDRGEVHYFDISSHIEGNQCLSTRLIDNLKRKHPEKFILHNLENIDEDMVSIPCGSLIIIDDAMRLPEESLIRIIESCKDGYGSAVCISIQQYSKLGPPENNLDMNSFGLYAYGVDRDSMVITTVLPPALLPIKYLPQIQKIQNGRQIHA